MTQMIQCDEGHFYDKSQNASCPHCGIGPVQATRKYEEGADADGDGRTRMAAGEQRTGAAAPSPRSGDPEITVAVWSKGGGIDPVVGWLVCHEGPNQGRDYRIRSGYNTIGRDTGNQICIAGDDTIAREEHARIFFDIKKTAFHLIAGKGRSGAYVNNDVVLQSVVLQPYDTVEIGTTRLIFVPFCGERFRWDTSRPVQPGAPAAAPAPRDDGDDMQTTRATR
ncbi:FHA domain-containing protein [Pseudorhodoferax sp.]|uniref:FHA domain-containing protein n=1 Tax=Pseudorhodoferax sp. TaxID=1993553 RepID=UPI002DD64610|nr:FHA domain-containing protein [Pseudorhodoferax sp.]